MDGYIPVKGQTIEIPVTKKRCRLKYEKEVIRCTFTIKKKSIVGFRKSKSVAKEVKIA
jgi:hypothetical protein